MEEMMEFPASVEEFMESYKIIDSDHVYTNGVELIPIFRMRQWFEHLDSAIKTNADRIRSMSDEELAEWFAKNDPECDPPEWWLGWLREEATDG